MINFFFSGQDPKIGFVRPYEVKQFTEKGGKMNAMTDPSKLKKYLAGLANDEEIQQCEAYLNNPENLVDVDEIKQDSLLDTVRNLANETTAVLVDEDLIAQIQQMVPERTISKDELERILDDAQTDAEIGRIGRFPVIEFIASGGMGLVFKAIDPNLDRAVCIKVLNPMMSTNSEAKARFAREAKAAAKLRNDRIVTVLEVGQHRDLPFLVMQLLDGQSLRRRMEPGLPLPAATARKYALQIAEGLRYAHGLGYLHRDIKPENIWLTPEDDIKLLDFGLARAFDETTHLTNTGTIIGTPSYMSPEQVQGKELDERSDLFSLGSVFFEMLTGENPFGKANVFSTMMSVANDTLPLPSDSESNAIPWQLVPVLQKLLAKDPENRIESADQLVGVLSDEEAFVIQPAIRSFRPDAGGIARMILGAVAGAAAIAIAMFIYQITDKGKLVVEAAPGVEVNIKDETIRIHDPQTGKDFLVTIGETPLPSGVYQLTMESDDFQFSSNVITIRRGEDELVKIELKPNSDLVNESLTAQPESASSKTKTLLTLNSVPELNKAEVISQFLPTTRPGILTPIAPQCYSVNAEGDSLTESVQPTLMLNMPDQNGFAINSDGSLFSTIGLSEYFLRIWDRDGQFKLMVPSQGEIKSVYWSPIPNTFAVIEQISSNENRVVVWRLDQMSEATQSKSDIVKTSWQAEIVKVISWHAVQAGWAWDGMRLALSDGENISFFDFETGKIVASPNFGINGEISERPWSSDGRFFAARAEDKSDVEVWDLKNKTLLHVFREALVAQFAPEKNFISVMKARIASWESWDMDTFQRVDNVNFRAEDLKIESGGFRFGFSAWPDHGFNKIACVTEDGKLAVIDTQTRSKSVTNLPFKGLVFRDFDKCTFRWSSDGLTLIGNFGRQFAIAHLPSKEFGSAVEKSRLGNTLKHFSEPTLLPTLFRPYYPMRSASVSQNGRISFLSDRMSGKGAVDLETYDLQKINYMSKPESQPTTDMVVNKIAPDGTKIAIAYRPKSNLLSGSKRNGESTISIVDSVTGQQVVDGRTIGNILDIHWSEDSGSIVVFKEIQVANGDDPTKWNRHDAVKILDLKNQKLRQLDLGDLALIQLSSPTFPVFKNNQVAVRVTDSNILDSKFLGLFDISSGKLVEKIALPSDHNDFLFNKELLITQDPNKSSGRKRDSIPTQTAILMDRQRNKVVKEVKSTYGMSLSPAHPYYAWSQADKELPTVFSSSAPVEIRIERFDFETGKTESVFDFDCRSVKAKKLVWHSTEPIVSWSDVGKWYCFNVESKELSSWFLEGASAEIVATPDGWLVMDGVALKQFNLEGKLVKTCLSAEQVNKEDWTGRLNQCISANGKVVGSNLYQLRIVRMVENRIENIHFVVLE